MSPLLLSAAFSNSERLLPILDGTVRVDGIGLAPKRLSPGEIFWRQLSGQEFDVSEMSLASLAILTANGNRDWLAMPIFPVRRFVHTEVLVRRASPIRRPQDLNGGRIGVSEYQQSANVWIRGILAREFAFDPSSCRWWMERNPQYSHAFRTGFTMPASVQLHYIDERSTLADLLLAGDIEAVFYYAAHGTALDRSVLNLKRHPAIRGLFEDPHAEARRYYKKTGVIPMTHCIVVRRSLAEEHHDVVSALWELFDEARAEALRRTMRHIEGYRDIELVAFEHGELGDDTDPLRYGLHIHRRPLDEFLTFVHEQGLTSRRVSVDEIFGEVGAIIE